MNQNKQNEVMEYRIAMKKLGTILNYLILPIMIVILWETVTRFKVFPAVILPPIGMVVRSFIDQFKSGQLLADLAISIQRVLEGYSISVVLGVTLGVFMGISEKMNKFFILSLNAIRQIPIIAWMPLIILWAGIDEASKVVIIVIGSIFPILVNTINGIKLTPKEYLEVGQMFKLSKWDLLQKIYFPSAIPFIFTGLKLGLGTSWMVVVAAEIIAASSGIGYRINDARSLMRPEVVIVGMIMIAIIGVFMDQILSKILKKITPWRG
jgi:sulfonate transport system permease protein